MYGLNLVKLDNTYLTVMAGRESRSMSNMVQACVFYHVYFINAEKCLVYICFKNTSAEVCMYYI